MVAAIRAMNRQLPLAATMFRVWQSITTETLTAAA
jgi:hypothetical protein